MIFAGFHFIVRIGSGEWMKSLLYDAVILYNV